MCFEFHGTKLSKPRLSPKMFDYSLNISGGRSFSPFLSSALYFLLSHFASEKKLGAVNVFVSSHKKERENNSNSLDLCNQ